MEEPGDVVIAAGSAGGRVRPVVRFAVGLGFPLALVAGACRRAEPVDETTAGAVALRLLPSASTGRAIFPGEDLAAAFETRENLEGAAVRRWRETVRAAAEAGDLLALVRWRTLQGNFDEALRLAESLDDSPNPEFDLVLERAAILLERHRATGRTLDAVAALELLAGSRAAPATHYNRVLAFCTLGLSAQARLEAARLEGSGAAERAIRTRLSECLSEPGVGRADGGSELSAELAALRAGDSAPLRDRLESREIAAWLASPPDEPRRAPMAAASELARATGDTLLEELFGDLAAAQPGEPAWEAARIWTEAERHRVEFRPEAALEAALGAQRASGEASPAWGARVEISRIAALFHLQRYDEAIDAARGLRDRVGSRPWHDLAARCDWLEGLAQLQVGRPALALRLFRAGSERFERAVAPGLAASLRALEADARGALGEFEQSLSVVVEALPRLARHGLTSRREVALESCTFPLLRKGYARAALAFADEAIAASGPDADPLTVAEQQWSRARALFASERPQDALAATDQALAAAARIESPAFRDRTESGIRATRGTVLAAIDPKAALNELSATVERGRGAKFAWFLPDFLLAQARALRALGEADRALAALQRAFEVADRAADGVTFEFDRALLGDTRRRLDEEAVDLADRDLRDPELALELALRSHRPATVRRSSTRARRCEHQTATLAVFALPDRLIYWLCDGPRLVSSDREVGRAEVARRIDELRRRLLMRSPDTAWQPEAETLFEWLLGPVAPELRAGRGVRLALDGPLAGAPIAALRDAVTGRFAIDGGAIVLAADWDAPIGPDDFLKMDSPVVVVADPELAEDRVPLFPPLPHAREEAREIATRFPRSRLLTGADATRAALESALPGATVLHVAAHGTSRNADAGAAAILLAGEGPAAEWSARDIADRALPGLRLVVLSACESGTGFETSTVGALSLARAFQSAGARDVVATQWAVDDAVGKRFMTIFYEGLTNGSSPAEALAATQRRFAASPDPRESEAAAWAGYFIMRGAPTPRDEGR